MSSDSRVDRRSFVKVAGGAVAATSLIGPESVLGQTTASRRRYAIIGTGDRATGMWGRAIRERYSDVVEFVGFEEFDEVFGLGPRHLGDAANVPRCR